MDDVSNAQFASLISDGNYVSTLGIPLSATAQEISSGLVALATKLDNDLFFADTIGTLAPLKLTGATISSGICTIAFDVAGQNPSNYFTAGDKIKLALFSPASGTLNGIQTVASVSDSPKNITFNTTASGAVTVTGATIKSGTYENIAQPGTIDLPTPNSELLEIQTYLEEIITGLQFEKSTGTPPAINSVSQIDFIEPLSVTKASSVKLVITIPEGITTDYFLQIYRSPLSTATGTTVLDDLTPSDELQLVYEAYPTSAEISASEMVVIDVTPDEFRGANLYTNPATGEGILQANDLPPFAKDVNRFKNVVFYANTRTRQRKQLSLLGVQNMITDYNNSIIPKVTILQGNVVNTYSFVTGVAEVNDVLCDTGSTLNASGPGSYFLINSAQDETEYYVWYQIGTSTDPAIAGKIGIEVVASASDTAAQIATKTASTIKTVVIDFDAEIVTSTTVRIYCQKAGYTTAAVDGDTGFTITEQTAGRGENASNNEVLLSSAVSVATAVDETARSFIRVLNKNNNEVVYGYYLSSANDVPGKIFLEAKTLSSEIFYIIGNNANTGASFNPDISGDFVISGVTLGSSPVITTVAAHGLANGDNVVISMTDSTPVIDGIYTVYAVTTNTFQIDLPLPITIIGTSGTGIKDTNSVFSENEAKINRVYYSKFQQPESVPLLNYLDVGDADKEILRIFPLRDSLFVFKEEGLYRISGETAPFTLALFDSSTQLTAPDSVDVNNNLLYGLTTQGVITVSEGGVNIISRAIDDIILKIPVFSNYKTRSFGVGYESDNSYTLWTVQTSNDESATIGFRYSSLTNTWTAFNKQFGCGFINPSDDRSYYGAGDINYIEQERKDFTRLDYADREYTIQLTTGNYLNNVLKLNSVSNISVGDVLTQSQFLTVYQFNMLLKKLDTDTGIVDNDYYSTLKAVGGADLRSKLVALAAKLDADPKSGDHNYSATIASLTGSITSNSAANPTVVTTSAPHNLLTGRYVSITSSNSTPSISGSWTITKTGASTFTVPTEVTVAGSAGSFTTLDSSFQDIKGCYNIIITKLNADTGVGFSNYAQITTTTDFEAIVTSIDAVQKKVTLNLTLDFVLGPLTQYKAINTSIVYSPNTFGSALTYKHLREATVMFESQAFTSATLSFATDLLPEMMPVPFSAQTNGIFGHQQFGSGFFGGGAHAAPHRTWIPRQCHRCRFIITKFEHSVAREYYRIYGISITGEDTGSTRAYRG